MCGLYLTYFSLCTKNKASVSKKGMKLSRGVAGFIQLRYLSSKRKLAVVGSGPSAFYTVLNILKEKPNDFEIDMFERNPSPFGLVRYGVAPDHPEVKNCIDRFNDVSEFIPTGAFKYYGNVSVSDPDNHDGKPQLSLKDLYQNYNGVLYAYGSSSANVPELAGIEHPAVIDSFSFVGWYNGHPKHEKLKVPLEKVENVTIIGNGNVAIDIIRVLLAPPTQHWAKTDISKAALEVLEASKVKNINVVARRGVLESKFTNKELRELLEMDKIGVFFSGWNSEEFKDELKETKLDRVNKRRVSLLDKYIGKYSDDQLRDPKARTWSLQYLKSPIGVKVKDDELLSETIFSVNKKVKSAESGKWEIQPAGKITSVSNELLILATGYKCGPLSEFKELGIPFEKGRIPNDNGKVDGVEHSYCVGWVGNGSTGNINSTVVDSMNVSITIVNDMCNNGDTDVKKGREAIDELLHQKAIRSVTWDDWNQIHKKEIEEGSKTEKPYEKMTFKKMLEVV